MTSISSENVGASSGKETRLTLPRICGRRFGRREAEGVPLRTGRPCNTLDEDWRLGSNFLCRFAVFTDLLARAFLLPLRLHGVHQGQEQQWRALRNLTMDVK